MGGCTVSKVTDTIEQLFEYMKEQILAGANAGLWADSELVIIKPGEEKAKLFEVKYEGDPQDGDLSVDFKETMKGRAFHVGVAAAFGEKPGPDQLVGMVHLHT